MGFAREIRVLIDEALTIAESSPDVRDEEPVLLLLAERLRAHPEHRDLAEDQLISLAADVASTPDPPGGVELLAYLVHALHLPRLLSAVEELHRTARAAGSTGRQGEHARRMEWVLEAREPDWEDREMFWSLQED